MPGFKLEQVDGEGEGEHIDLPDGDSVIGRGPFLHVSDKRVSRNHGILQNVDGQLRLKPTHVNPCFVQTSPDAVSEPLEKDKWHRLRDGEIFSLLPGKYIYRVHAVGEEGTPRNSQGFEEAKEEEETTELNSKPPRSCEETLAYTPQAESSPSFTYESKTGAETHTAGPAVCSQAGADSLPSCKSNAPDLLTPRKKRVLPAWMMDAAPAASNTPPAKAKRAPVRSTSSSKRSAGPKRPQPRVPSLSGDDEEREWVEEEEDDEGCSKTQRKRARRQNRKQVEEEEEDEGCSKTPRKRARRLKSDTEESQEQDPVPKSNVDMQPDEKSTKTGHNVAQNVEEEEQEEKRVGAGGSQRSRTLSLESSGNSQTNVRQKAKTRHRTPCPFGTSCYRKNPVHFQECSHPGDSDYEEEQNNKDDDDDDDDRPECPYGTDCYRKNPLHKKEYKHTKPSAPVNDDDDEDEDQYENSFINDDSEEEDVDEDSDYVPESEDSGKEDIKRLQKEAKAFIKKKKK
ncbi:aprataxin and PNK-like factor [Clarias gariepinus]|uniref:aprataxin and PNK-like factor n=1 Tax=Clarias gariepinus TaxID=13013 RepID=UPI00234CDC61|nr:aprataxin and PNK-like factor [Clarias gariepinus]XP_053332487.1 aprataxin and PNK-like factor [Clarias gariepinus]